MLPGLPQPANFTWWREGGYRTRKVGEHDLPNLTLKLMPIDPWYFVCHRDALIISLLSPQIYCMAVAVPWLRRLVGGLSPRRPKFDPRSVHVGFAVDKVALGQVFPRVLRFSPVNFIPSVLHYKEKRKKLIIFITGLPLKGCGASVASAVGPFTTKKNCMLRYPANTVKPGYSNIGLCDTSSITSDILW
jgi:hypothetical protein